MRKFSALAVLATMACGGAPAAGTPAPEPASRREFSALTIVPRSASACPGEVISVEYKGRLADGSTVTLSRGEIASLSRSGTAVEPRSDGSWQANAEPLLSAVDGFRLSASLAGNGAVKSDTVVRPTYECLGARNNVDIRPPILDRFTPGYVRIGLLRSPFYDSLVVAILELPSRSTSVFVLPPSAMRPGAIRFDASGRPGQPGRGGRNGSAGSQCENGADGENGDDGTAGGDGGTLNIIVETEAPWLDRLVSISNAGGVGGAGGRGGTGGAAGRRTGSSGGGCNPKPGRMGISGRPGPSGTPGATPRTSHVLSSLLWSGSPIWNDEVSRAALEKLIEYTKTAR